jgi:predicted permease
MTLFSRRRTHDDFSDEVQAHLDLETDRLIADGMSADAARAAAERAFGSVAIVKERFYEASRWMWLEQLLQDLRYAWRGMRHSPAFVATTVVTLAVGLGLLTVAFTIFNAYVLRPFAIRDPGSLHQIVWHARDGGGQGFRWRDYDELRERTDLFSAVIGEHTHFVSSDGRPLMAAIVSVNYFDALGPAMSLGRGLGSIDANGTGNPAVLSHQTWTRLFDRDPSAVGREIDLNGRAFTIVGVLAPAFTGLGDSPRDVFVPMRTAWAAPRRVGANQIRETEILVRLQPDVSRVRAETELTPFMARVIEKQEAVRAVVRPQSSPNTLSVEMMAILSPVFAAFVLVLVTACANVSNVMLARAIARHREMAVRLSIGASRGRLIRQLLTEGLLIAVLAGVAGLGLAAWGLRVATVALFNTLPPSVAPLLRLTPLTFDARVFLFALAVSAAATLLFALMPALQASGISLTDALRGQGGAARHGSRLRNALVIGQVAVALVLVITAVTIARNGAAVGAMDLGFDTDGVMSVNVRGEQDELARPLAEALAADARVASVAVTSGNPLFNQVRIVAAAPADASTAATKRTRCTFVSPEFFRILRMPIARGRGFRIDEARSAAPVAIVSAATANAFWPGEDPIGKTIRIERPEGRSVDELPGYPGVTVVGTVRDIVTGMMVVGHDAGHIYLPMSSADVHATAILVRGRTDRDLGAEALQEIFRRVVPDPQVFEALPLDEVRDLQMYPLLAASWVGSLLGLVALALSVSGLYGVLTYAISQRRKEIGIRMALGATARAVVGLVLQQSARLAGIGALIGVVVTFAVMKVLSAAIHLERISLLDIAAFGAGLALVMAATVLAAYQPARRATRVDPSQTLRSDA